MDATVRLNKVKSPEGDLFIPPGFYCFPAFFSALPGFDDLHGIRQILADGFCKRIQRRATRKAASEYQRDRAVCIGKFERASDYAGIRHPGAPHGQCRHQGTAQTRADQLQQGFQAGGAQPSSPTLGACCWARTRRGSASG